MIFHSSLKTVGIKIGQPGLETRFKRDLTLKRSAQREQDKKRTPKTDSSKKDKKKLGSVLLDF